MKLAVYVNAICSYFNNTSYGSMMFTSNMYVLENSFVR